VIRRRGLCGRRAANIAVPGRHGQGGEHAAAGKVEVRNDRLAARGKFAPRGHTIRMPVPIATSVIASPFAFPSPSSVSLARNADSSWKHG